jgi:hypothetical protein
MFRSFARSGRSSRTVSSARSKNVRSTARISYSAKAAPTQRRIPPPNGIHA